MQSQVKTHKNGRHKSSKRHFRWLIIVLGLSITATIAGVAGVVGAYYYVAPSLPAAETIRDIPLQIPLRVFSRDGHLIAEFGERRRIHVPVTDLGVHAALAHAACDQLRGLPPEVEDQDTAGVDVAHARRDGSVRSQSRR